jgi:hypothetical protein
MVSMCVADTGSKRVLQLPVTNWVYSAQSATTVLSGLINPVDVGIDGAGNVYVVDAGSGNNDGGVIMVPKKYDGTLDSANPVVLLSATVNNNLNNVNYGAPRALSVFTGGNMFVAYADKVIQVPNENGALNFAAQYVVASGFTNLMQVAGDQPGNLYVADAGNPAATPSNSAAYTTTTANVTLTVNKAVPTITFTGAPASAPYQATFTVSATTNASTTAMITASGACTSRPLP